MLPTQKKSAEELAKLRESLGIPSPADEPELVPALRAAIHPPPPPSAAPTSPPPPPPEEPVSHLDVPVPEPQPVRQKPLGSMRRQEILAPAPPHEPSNIKLPDHRHAPAELADLRRRIAVKAIAEGGYAVPVAAPAPLLVVAYLLAVGGACAPFMMIAAGKLADYQTGLMFSKGYDLLVAGCLAALPLAAFIAWRKTLSRHHAAFLTIISVFALIFSLLHYFPALRYGS